MKNINVLTQWFTTWKHLPGEKQNIWKNHRDHMNKCLILLIQKMIKFLA